MKQAGKRIILLSIMALVFILCMVALVACGGDEGEPDTDTPPTQQTERIKFSNTDGVEGATKNPNAGKNWDEFKELTDWEEKWNNDDLYYVFEGVYTDSSLSTNTYLYMNCYEDGLIHARFADENFYGYWTNVDDNGNISIVLHVLAYDNGTVCAEYNHGIYEEFAGAYDGPYYDYQSSIIWSKYSTRIVMIYGYRYAPLSGISVDASKAKCEYLIGDPLDTNLLDVTVSRDGGKTDKVDEVTGEYTPLDFAGYDPDKEGTQTITVTYGREKVTATYDVTVVGIKSLTIDLKNAKREYRLGDKVDNAGINVTVTYKNGATREISAENYTVTGFDSSAVTDKQTLTVTYGDASATYDISVVAPTYTGNGIYDGVRMNMTISVIDLTTCCVDIAEKSAVFNYKMFNALGNEVMLITAPADLTGMTPDEVAKMHRVYVIDANDGYHITDGKVYMIPDTVNLDDGEDNGDDRTKYEVMPISRGMSEQRFIFVDEQKNECTLTYKYFSSYFGGTCIDIFSANYELTGNTLHFKDTKRVQDGGGKIEATAIVQTYTLRQDGVALSVKG